MSEKDNEKLLEKYKNQFSEENSFLGLGQESRILNMIAELEQMFNISASSSKEEFEERKAAMIGFFLARSERVLDQTQRELGFTSGARK